MKIAKYIAMFAAALFTGVACVDELEKVQIVDPSDVIYPVLTSMEESLVFEAENLTNKYTFTWDAADFGVKTQINYAIEAATATAGPIEITSGIVKTSAEVDYELINERLFNGLVLDAAEPTLVDFMVSAKIGEGQKYYSEPVKVLVSVTAAEKKYPMVYVIGSFNGWADGTTQELFDFDGKDSEYSGMIGFGGKAANGFKVRGSEKGWDNELGNWGLDSSADAPAAESPEIPLISDGGSSDIKIYSKDFYNFTLVKGGPALKVNFAFNTVGVIGTAVGGWDSDIDLTFDTVSQKFYADVTLSEGEMKFRADDAWDLNWGVATAGVSMTEGSLNGGGNITVPAGNYRIYLNLNNPADPSFELNADDYGAAVEEQPGDSALSGKTKTLYFMPGSWAGEGITFAAWIWPTDGSGSWYDVTDSDGDGVYEVTFPVEYTNIIFASMNGDTDWANKVNQTPDMVVPTDSSNAYDATSDAWVVYNAESGSADRILYFKPNADWSANGVTFAAWAWATGANGSWYAMADSDGDGVYEVTIPSGIDNIIFASMNGDTDWANKVKQTNDLVIPTDGKNLYDIASGTWVASAGETPDTPDVPEGAVAAEWGLIGSMDASGSWSNNITLFVEGDYFVARGVVFKDNDQFKFRKGNSWGVELTYEGGITIDAKLDLIDGAGGKQNSSISKGGTYDVYLASDLSAFYVMTPGKTPAQAGAAEKVYVDPSDASFNVGFSGSAIGWDDPAYDHNDRATFVSKNVTDNKTFAGTYEFKLDGITFAAGDEFKVRINGQWIGVGGATIEGLAVSGGDNFIAGDAGTFNAKITFAWDGNTHSDVKVVFTK